MAIDSVRFEDFYSLLYKSLGLSYTSDMLKQHKKLDERRSFKYAYEQHQNVRRQKAILISQRIQKMIEKVLDDKKRGNHIVVGLQVLWVNMKERRKINHAKDISGNLTTHLKNDILKTGK